MPLQYYYCTSEAWGQRSYWARDGIHPNDKGYTVWGEHIAQGIVRQALLTSPGRAA